MKSVNPYLNFSGNTEEAFHFYKSVFGGEVSDLVRFRDMPNTMCVPEEELDLIAHIALPLGDYTLLMANDIPSSMPMELSEGNNFYIQFETDSAEEARGFFEALSEGGSVEMKLQNTDWAELFGSCVDRFGVQWMVMFG